LRILVVDDLADSAVGLAQLLRHQSHEVATAHDGGDALSTARDFRPNAVLLDLGLPGVDGFEVARRLRAEFPKGLQLIAVSGYGQPDHRRRSREAGFDHHLLKPVDLDELTRLLSIHRGPSGP
jgi:DNA-binding response OmpR family regulator